MKTDDFVRALAMVSGMRGWPKPWAERKPVKCRLKDCHRMTTHNGGYCCAEHCKLDRERQKKGPK